MMSRRFVISAIKGAIFMKLGRAPATTMIFMARGVPRGVMNLRYRILDSYPVSLTPSQQDIEGQRVLHVDPAVAVQELPPRPRDLGRPQSGGLSQVPPRQ